MGSFTIYHAVILVLIALILAIYATPGFIAYRRRHPSRHAIIAVNVLFGWSVIGWAVALVWALKRQQP